jgi:hypothetical protein
MQRALFLINPGSVKIASVATAVLPKSRKPADVTNPTEAALTAAGHTTFGQQRAGVAVRGFSDASDPDRVLRWQGSHEASREAGDIERAATHRRHGDAPAESALLLGRLGLWRAEPGDVLQSRDVGQALGEGRGSDEKGCESQKPPCPHQCAPASFNGRYDTRFSYGWLLLSTLDPSFLRISTDVRCLRERSPLHSSFDRFKIKVLEVSLQ